MIKSRRLLLIRIHLREDLCLKKKRDMYVYFSMKLKETKIKY